MKVLTAITLLYGCPSSAHHQHEIDEVLKPYGDRKVVSATSAISKIDNQSTVIATTIVIE